MTNSPWGTTAGAASSSGAAFTLLGTADDLAGIETSLATGLPWRQTWDQFDAADWLNASGSGTLTTPTNGMTGGKVLQAAGPRWIVWGKNIPFDSTRIYRLRVRYQQIAEPTSGTKLFYSGLEGVAQDGVTLIGAVGGSQYYSQHYYPDGVSNPVDGWHEYVGYWKGNSAGNGTSGNASPNAPGTLHSGVCYVRPLLVFNYGSVGGIQQVDFLDFSDATDDVALEKLDVIASDGFLAREEVPSVQDELDALEQSVTAVQARATGMGLSSVTEYTTLTTKWGILLPYVDALIATASTSVGRAVVVRATWRTNWQAVYIGVVNLQAAMAKKADDAVIIINDPDTLSLNEKPQIVQESAVLVAGNAQLVADANTYAAYSTVAADLVTYNAAYTALYTTYLPTLTAPVLWSNLTGTTALGASGRVNNWNPKWQALRNAAAYLKSSIANAVYGKAIADAAVTATTKAGYAQLKTPVNVAWTYAQRNSVGYGKLPSGTYTPGYSAMTSDNKQIQVDPAGTSWVDVVVAATAILGKVFTNQLVVSNSENLVPDSTFSAGTLDEWQAYPSGAVPLVNCVAASVATADGITGTAPTAYVGQVNTVGFTINSYLMAFTHHGGWAGGGYDIGFVAAPNEELLLSVDCAKTSDFNGITVRLLLYYQTGNTTWSGSSIVPGYITLAPTTAWGTYTGSFKLPSTMLNGARCRLAFVVYDHATAPAGKVYFTNLRCKRKTTAEALVDGIFTATFMKVGESLTSLNYVTGTKTVAPTGLKLSGQPFNVTLLGADSTTQVCGEIGGNMSFGGKLVSVVNTAVDSSAAITNAMASDGILSMSEKPSNIINFSEANTDYATLSTRASAAGVSCLDLTAAYNALSAYMTALSPAYTLVTADTPINATTWKSLWGAWYDAKTATIMNLAAAAPSTAAAMSTSNYSLTTNATLTIDGMAMSSANANNIVILANQTTASQNAVYTIKYTDPNGTATYTYPNLGTAAGTGTYTGTAANAYDGTTSAPTDATYTTSTGPTLADGFEQVIFSGWSGTGLTGTLGIRLTPMSQNNIDGFGGETWVYMSTDAGVTYQLIDSFGPAEYGVMQTVTLSVSGEVGSDLRVKIITWSMAPYTEAGKPGEPLTAYAGYTGSCRVNSVYFYQPVTGSANFSFTKKANLTDDSVWRLTGGATYGGGLWKINVSDTNVVTKTVQPYDPGSYDVNASIAGKPAAAAKVLVFVAPRPFTIHATGHKGKCYVNPTTTAGNFVCANNGTTFGTCSFSTAGVFSISGFAATAFATGDILTITAPGTQNTTLADIGLTLRGSI